jgi:tetratricopeptide (TPR) repeat protein
MAMFDQHAQRVHAQYNAEHITICTQATPRPVDPDTLTAAEQQFAALPLETIPDPAPLPVGSRLPFRPNPLFVGRESELRHLAQVLKGNGIAAIGQIAATTGLGGLGKTQLAVEFAHRYGQYFAGGVFWLNCATPEAIPHEVAACGGAGGMQLHPDFHALPLEEQVRGVQRAWQSPVPRLLVFDNCEHQELIAQWRPTSGGCRVLLTSRRASWDVSLGITTLALDVLSRAESIALLRQFRPDLAPSNPDLEAIATELGDLPLALHLAGSFLARYRQAVTPAGYLAQLQRPDLLAHPSLQGWQLTRALSPTRHEQHVARTFALSYDCLDPADPIDVEALALLARAAYFAPGQPILRDLLLATVAWAPESPNSAIQAEDALGRLRDLGLLESDTTDTVRLHRLLMAFVRGIARDTVAQTAVEDKLIAEAERLLNAGYPAPLLPLHPHLRTVTEDAQQRGDTRTAHLHASLGSALYMIGDYASAQSYYQRALTLWERVLGPDHPSVAVGLGNLASVYQAQGRYAEAELLLQRAQTICERVLGPDHPSMGTSLNNLASLYRAQGRYAEAELLYQRALATRERALGLDHPDTAMSLDNLAGLYRTQGRYAEAEPLQQRALAIYERVLGPDHPSMGTYLNNLAEFYRAQGHYREAEPLYQRVLALNERVLGPDHPGVGIGLNNLAMLYAAQGRYTEAEPLLQRTLTLWGRVLGPNHPSVGTSLDNLAGIYHVQDRYHEAEPLYQRALAIHEHGLGPDHPDVATNLNNLAELYQAQGRYDAAEPLLQRALAIVERVLGPDHPNLGTNLNNLALLYYTQGRYTEAEPLYQRALAIYGRVLGPDHPNVATNLNNLANLYRAQGRYAEAEPLYQRVLAIYGRVPGRYESYTAVLKATDHVQSSPKPTYTKVGRNAPCPCGSGKKYKRCHGR